MISLSSREMYNLLRANSEKEAQVLTEYISVQIKEGIHSEVQYFASKEDLAIEIGLLRKEIAESKQI